MKLKQWFPKGTVKLYIALFFFPLSWLMCLSTHLEPSKFMPFWKSQKKNTKKAVRTKTQKHIYLKCIKDRCS